MEISEVRGISHDVNETKITLVQVPDKPGTAAKIFKALGDAHIVVDMIVQNYPIKGRTEISFTVNKNDADEAEYIARKVAEEIGAKDVERNDNIGKVSIIGLGMKTTSGTAGKMFKVLANNGINIHAISTSEIKISCLIDEDKVEKAVKELHKEFIEK